MNNDRKNISANGKLKKLVLIAMSVFIAVAIGITCSLCFIGNSDISAVDGAQTGAVRESTTYADPVSGTDFSPQGVLFTGDVITYSYSTNIVSVKLPVGIYEVEVYGAEGGTAQASGGKGGRMSVRFTANAVITLYICTGGAGAKSPKKVEVTAGGYNGGGSTDHKACGHKCSGTGGGATHVAFMSGVLSTLSSVSNQAKVIAVGGGGGGGWGGNGSSSTVGNGNVSGGAGGYPNGGNTTVCNRTNTSTGGSQTGGGTYSGGTNPWNSKANGSGNSLSSGYAGSFGQGGRGAYCTPGGGGGGGGWYGGAGGGGYGERAMGGAGGSSYANTNQNNYAAYNCTYNSFTYANGVNSGNGSARINVISVNRNPVATANVYKNLGTRGKGKTINVSASELATDPDAGQTLHFTNGVSGNYDQLDTNSNRSLYLNSNCTQLADPYIDWKFLSNQTIQITALKKYISGGSITLYTKVRDNFGITSTRGVCLVSFTITCTDGAIGLIDTGNNTNGADIINKGTPYVEYTYTTTDSAGNAVEYVYRRGKSSKGTAAADKTFDYTNNGFIYNPTNNNVETVFIPNPLTPNRTGGFTVYAADLYTDADSPYDIVGISSVTPLSISMPYSSYYSISYTVDNDTYGTSGLYRALTIRPTALRPEASLFIVMEIDAQSVERDTKTLMPTSRHTSLQLVFKVANTRPHYASSLDNPRQNIKEPKVSLTVGGTAQININDFLYDPDGTMPSFITTGVESSRFKVPTHEYVMVTRDNVMMSMRGDSNYYSTVNGGTTPVDNTWETAEGNRLTGFPETFPAIGQRGTPAGNVANIMYSYSSDKQTITFEARAATKYMYATEGREGHFYVLVRIYDEGDPSDVGIWYPISIEVRSTAPEEPTVTASVMLGFSQYTPGSAASDAVDLGIDNPGQDVVYFTPISYYDDNGILRGVGSHNWANVGQDGKQDRPFVTDKDTFLHPATATNLGDCARKMSEVVCLNYTADPLEAIEMNNAQQFFRVEAVDMYAAQEVFGDLDEDQMRALHITKLAGNQNYYVFKGISIAPLRYTGDMYYEFDVKVVDAHETTNKIRIYVKVANRSVNLRRDPSTEDVMNYSKYPVNEAKSGKYTKDAQGNRYVNYTLEMTPGKNTAYITPYDLAYDFDTASGINVHSGGQQNNSFNYNSNPYNGDAFKDIATEINREYEVRATTSPTESADTQRVTCGRLSFTNKDLFESAAGQYGAYFSAEMFEYVRIDGEEYAIPVIYVTAVSRTALSVLTLRVTISDGISSVNCLIAITVRNAAPYLVSDRVYEMAVEPQRGSTPGSDIPSLREFEVTDLASDYDGTGDIANLSFVSGSVRIVSPNRAGDYYTHITINDETKECTPTDQNYDSKAIPLSTYVTAQIARGTGSMLGKTVIRIEAKSSTQTLTTPIYLEFRVTDGYRLAPAESTLRVPIEVLNTAPKFDLGMVKLIQTKEDDDESASSNQPEKPYYTWDIEYKSEAQKLMPRYIVNCRELYDSDTLKVPQTNKVMLFDDADKAQRLLLDPVSGKNSNGIASRVELTESSPVIDESLFTKRENAAILYSQTYAEGNSEDNRFLTITVEYYEKTGDRFTRITNPNMTYKNDLSRLTYWAIRIEDKTEQSNSSLFTQIAIAVRDDHHGENAHVYRFDAEGKTRSEVSTANRPASNKRLMNFYYTYLSPGITVMHSYYRTDGNIESTYSVDTSEINKRVDIDYLYDYQLKDGKSAVKADENGDKQDGLALAEFTSDFQYQYFVNFYTDDDNNEIETPKMYPNSPSNAFYYKPLELDDSTDYNVPLSYFALPSTYGALGTEGRTHVTFATLDKATDSVAGDEYKSWTIDTIKSNITLSDGASTLEGQAALDNEYIQIEYMTSEKTTGFTPDLLNKHRAEVSIIPGMNPHEYSGAYQLSEIENWDHRLVGGVRVENDSIFREDKLGLKISKKSGSPRLNGTLRLTLALKTTEDTSQTQYAFIDINISNSKPKNMDTLESEGVVDKEIRISMDDAEGKYIDLVKRSPGSNAVSTIPGAVTVGYTDDDRDDQMLFAIATASDLPLGRVLTGAQLNAIKSNDNYISQIALDRYAADYDGVSYEGGEGDPHDLDELVVNPGYLTFFDVRPEMDSTTLQIVPRAKTQLNIPEERSGERDKYLKANNLRIDDKGDIYYPFRILFYDDAGGSGLVKGYWAMLRLKVYITNDALDKPSAKDEFSFDVTRGNTYAFNVSESISDNDMARNAQRDYITQDSEEWQALIAAGADDPDTEIDESLYAEHNATLVKDYIVMPLREEEDEESGTTVYTPVYRSYVYIPDDTAYREEESVPVKVTYSAPATLMFEPSSAFKTNIKIELVLSDLGGSSITVSCIIKYDNSAPTRNEDTYGGLPTINIVMRTGDSFRLYAADRTMFDVDRTVGKFNSPVYFDEAIESGKISSDYPDVTAGELKGAFAFATTETYDEVMAELGDGRERAHELGSLILGSDDAPSTLRFGDEVLFDKDNAMFDVVKENKLRTENSAGDSMVNPAMTLKVTARGVTSNTTLTLEIFDSEDKSVKVAIKLTVISTAPNAKKGVSVKYDTDPDPEVTREVTLAADNEEVGKYTLEMQYGDSFEALLDSFIEDVDRSDDQTLTVASVYAGAQFGVTEPAGVSPIAVTESELSGKKSIKITTRDFIPTEGEVTVIKFRVVDRHKCMSDEIEITVSVTPHEVQLTAMQSKHATIALKSYAQYIADDNTPVVISVIAESKEQSVIAYDADLNAPSAAYEVEIYAFIAESDGKFVTINDVEKLDDSNFIARNFGSKKYGSGSVYDYISRYFYVNLSDDGKTLTFTPNSATVINSREKVDKLGLYISISKAYNAGEETTQPAKKAYVDVTVDNSLPVAVKQSAVNFGYPMNGASLRSEPFLNFSGYAGDSLTWKLYDLEETERGLFYDYDMLNTIEYGEEDEIVVKGNDTLSYRSTYTTVLESYNGKSTPTDALTLTGDSVLSVTESSGAITVKINRIVRPSHLDGADEKNEPYYDIPLEIACGDVIGVGTDDVGKLVKTVIIVRVRNSAPEFKEVEYNKTNGINYSVMKGDIDGYVLDATLAYGQTLTVRIADIIDDRDIRVDWYSFNTTGDVNSLIKTDVNSPKDIKGSAGGVGAKMFSYYMKSANNAYGIMTVQSIEFTGTSYERGKTATACMQIYDSTNRDSAMTSKMTINLTVGNIAPTVKSEEDTKVTMLGAKLGADVDGPTYVGSILDFVDDLNPEDRKDVSGIAPGQDKGSYTYLFISEITVFTTDDSEDDRPSLYGPGVVHVSESGGEDGDDDEPGDPEIRTSVCMVDFTEDNDTHQKFAITPVPGVYGVQKVRIRAIDSGYTDGVLNYVNDGMSVTFEMYITVVRPLDDIELPSFKIANKVTRRLTPEILLNTEEEPHNADGYKITGLEVTGNLEMFAPEVAEQSAYVAQSVATSSDWRVRAKLMGGTDDSMTVKFDVSGLEVSRQFKVEVVENRAPILRDDEDLGRFRREQLGEGNVVVVKPEEWFYDEDIDDVMAFANPIKVQVGTYAVASLSGGDLVLEFKCRGETEITFSIGDASGMTYAHTIVINCTDIDPPNWFNSFVANLESHPVMWGLIFGGSLLLIILIIILVVIYLKRRKMRIELELLLDSDSGFDPNLLRIGNASTNYQSYGYLPPTPGKVVPNPNYMIGSAPTDPTPNNLQLGAGMSDAQQQSAQPKTVALDYPGTQSAPPVQPAGPAEGVQPAGDDSGMQLNFDGLDTDSF